MSQFNEKNSCDNCKFAATFMDEMPCKTCIEHDDFPDTVIMWQSLKLMEKDGYRYELP